MRGRKKTRHHLKKDPEVSANTANIETANSKTANEATVMAMDGPELPTDLQNLRTMLVMDMKGVLAVLMDDALSPLKDSLEAVKTTTASHEARLAEMEKALSEQSDRIQELTKECSHLKATNDTLSDRVEDAENRARRCNLRIINIPENSEGADTVKFMTEFFVEVLGNGVYPTPPVLERAYRLGQRQPNQQQKPRVMMVCFRYYQDKVRALEKDRNRLIWRGKKVAFFPDYAAHTAKLRASFTRVKSLLYEKKIKFRLVYPAVLKVEYGGGQLVFKTAEEAHTFYSQRVIGDGNGAAAEDLS